MIEGSTLWELIARRAEATPDDAFAIDENEQSLTFAQFRDAAERCAAGLAAEGVSAGTRVSWQLPTTIEALVLCGGLARLGAVQNPILPIYRENEVGFVVEQLGSEMLIVDGVLRAAFRDAHACLLRDASERSLWCWGKQAYGRLGPGTGAEETNTWPPTPMAESIGGEAVTDVVDFCLGYNHGCYIREVDGVNKTWCWGKGEAMPNGSGAGVRASFASAAMPPRPLAPNTGTGRRTQPVVALPDRACQKARSPSCLERA